MAEHSSDSPRKAELIAELAQARQQLAGGLARVREDLNVPKHLKRSFSDHKVVYIAGAAGVGWLIAVLPSWRRKAKPSPPRRLWNPREEKVEKGEKSGLLMLVLRFVFAVFKPALTAFVSKKVAEYGQQRGWRL